MKMIFLCSIVLLKMKAQEKKQTLPFLGEQLSILSLWQWHVAESQVTEAASRLGDFGGNTEHVSGKKTPKTIDIGV